VGGTANQVLQKNTATNYDVGWVTPSGGVSGLINKEVLFGGATGLITQDAQFLWDATVKELIVSPTQFAGYDTHIQAGGFWANANANGVPTTTTLGALQYNLDTSAAATYGQFGWYQSSPPLANPVVWTLLASLNKNAFNVTVPTQYKGINFTQLHRSRGSGAGNYTTATGSWVWVDTTNLQVTVTIPTGFYALCMSSGHFFMSGAGNIYVALADGTPSTHVGPSVLTTQTLRTPFAFLGVITGDGLSHTIGLAFAGSGATCTIGNADTDMTPNLVVLILPIFTVF